MTKKRNLTIEDFEIKENHEGVPHVEWDEIKKKMLAKRWIKFSNWMNGQTCVKEGVYPHDLDRFLRYLPNLD